MIITFKNLKMRKTNKLIIGFLALVFMISCNDGIDPISYVDPGPDAGAPIVNITYPVDGASIPSVELVSSIDVAFNVSDDIEIMSITVAMNGNEIASFNTASFVDYRNYETEVPYDGLTIGFHTLTVTATDIAGNTTVSTSNFEKAPPYSPLFAGEIFYMPFDGDYMEFVSLTFPEEIGNPIFANEAKIGANAYKGAPNSYLSFPLPEDLDASFSGMFWYKVNSSPDRAGILAIGTEDIAENRNQGLRLFREGNATEQRIKLNVGTGTGESWNDGGIINVADGEWVNVAFTISDSQTIIYFNGTPVNMGTMSGAIDWTGCSNITIGSGGPTFSYWNHLHDTSSIDELRLFNTTLSQEDIQNIILTTAPYEPIITGETLYMPFNGNYNNLLSGASANEVGTPGYSDDNYSGGQAFQSATDSYLETPINGLFGSEEFTAAFWYKVNSTPDRAGILVVGTPDIAENRNQGFRIFREGNATEQRIKLNVGIGGGESWNDGGVIDVTAGEWVHIAVTVSPTESNIYFNGEPTLTSTFGTPVDWTGCDNLTIGSGGPTFSYWNHLSDLSIIDELRVFNRALTQEEIQTLQ